MLRTLSLDNVEGDDECARADSYDAPVRDLTFDASALARFGIPKGVLQVVRKSSSWPRRIGALGIQLIQSASPTNKEFTSVIAIYIVTKNMTVEQHTEGRDRLREAGAPESAMKLHSCFGEDGQLQVFDVWESQEAFDEFLTYLGPVMEELGIELAQPPTIMPIVDLVQQ